MRGCALLVATLLACRAVQGKDNTRSSLNTDVTDAAFAVAAAQAQDSAAVVDLTVFETEVLPMWMKGFQVTDDNGVPVEGAFRESIGLVQTQ